MTTTRLLRVMLLCPLLLIMQLSWGQNKSISGTVTDDKGSPVAGASVLVKGAKTGTSTDGSGNFTISVPPSAQTLTITYVGFTDQSVDISGKTSVKVSLVAANQSLNEVVVIGYGTARKKDLTGAVSLVSSKDFNQGSISTPDQLVQSKVAGVLVTVNSGEPGAGTTIQIRGNSSLRASNNPLYVIDGVPLDGRNAEPGVSVTGFGVTPTSNPLLFINPADIASISILKDASAAAIYGSRGANGVVEITTKKGASGGMKIEAGVAYGVWAGYMKKFGVLSSSQFANALSKYKVPNADSPYINGGHSTNALDAITNKTVSQGYNLALSGGNENGHYRASFFASNPQGFIEGTELNKYVGSFSGTVYSLNKKLTIDFNVVVGNVGHDFGAIGNTVGSTGDLMTAALQWNPTQSFYNADGTYNQPTSGTGNPLALAAAVNDKAITNTILGNVSASYKILDNLEYKFLYSINHGSGVRNTNYDGWLQGYGGISGLGIGIISNALLNSQTFTHTLSYTANLTEKLHLNAVAGYEYWTSDFSNSTFSAAGFNTNLTQQSIIPVQYTSILQDGNTQFLPNTYVDPVIDLQSYFGRVILNWADKYLLTGTIREDGSSKFGTNNKYGTFPSVAGRWVVSNENFMKNSKVFSTLALRGSYGIVGNQEYPAGAAEEQFAFSAYNTFGQVNVYNPNLQWEQTASTDFGFDYGLLKGRIYGAFDYYDKKTTKLLYQSQAIQPAPATSTWQNLDATLSNKGFEFSIGASVVQHTHFSWDIGFNVANNKNLLTNYTGALIQTGQVNGQGVSGAFAEAIANNQPLDVYYLKPFQGFDANGNQIVDSAGKGPVFAGDPNPHTFYGVSTTLRYDKLSLTINGGGAGGFLVYNNTATSVTDLAGISKGVNVGTAAYNSVEQPSSAVEASTRFLESGNYFKLRNVRLQYAVGNVGKNAVKNLNVFVSGNNLFVITKFTGFDPEVSIDKSNGGYPSQSIEYAPYPTGRFISFGLNFSL